MGIHRSTIGPKQLHRRRRWLPRRSAATVPHMPFRAMSHRPTRDGLVQGQASGGDHWLARNRSGSLRARSTPAGAGDEGEHRRGRSSPARSGIGGRARHHRHHHQHAAMKAVIPHDSTSSSIPGPASHAPKPHIMATRFRPIVPPDFNRSIRHRAPPHGGPPITASD